jgi:ABC-type multidrug transport system fused ATPase/permease subunit
MPSVAEVRVLNLAPLLLSRFRSLMLEFLNQDWKLHVKGFRAGMTFGVVATIAVYALFVRVVFRAIEGAVTLGDVAIFGGATTGLRNAVEHTALDLRAVVTDSLFVRNVIEYLEHRARISGSEGREWSGQRGELRFEDVVFTYPGSTRPALRGVSLDVEAGETLAIVGENGAGKTTLVKLAARLYDPDEGRIVADGTDLREIATEDYHGKLGFVFQQFGRYEASAADNIAYGDWQRLLDDRAAIDRIVQRTGLSELISEMPSGLDTALGRSFGDYNPSAGQWQMIAVARALARDALILILDEPTASLDARAEHDLFIRFRELARGRTTLLISHRFSTVAMADRIAVMADGRIAEIGTHQQLLDLQGVYATLYSLHRREGFTLDGDDPKSASTAAVGPPGA